MSNKINDERLEDLQVYLNGKGLDEVYFDDKLGFYTVSRKTVSDEELAEEFTTEVRIKVLPQEHQDTLNLVRGIENTPADYWKEDLAEFRIIQD